MAIGQAQFIDLLGPSQAFQQELLLGVLDQVRRQQEMQAFAQAEEMRRQQIGQAVLALTMQDAGQNQQLQGLSQTLGGLGGPESMQLLPQFNTAVDRAHEAERNDLVNIQLQQMGKRADALRQRIQKFGVNNPQGKELSIQLQLLKSEMANLQAGKGTLSASERSSALNAAIRLEQFVRGGNEVNPAELSRIGRFLVEQSDFIEDDDERKEMFQKGLDFVNLASEKMLGRGGASGPVSDLGAEMTQPTAQQASLTPDVSGRQSMLLDDVDLTTLTSQDLEKIQDQELLTKFTALAEFSLQNDPQVRASYELVLSQDDEELERRFLRELIATLIRESAKQNLGGQQ